jgi:hypothetical protein
MITPQPVPIPMPSEWRVFHTVLAPEVINELAPPSPQAAYTPWVVAWLMVYQRLNNNATLNDAVTHFLFSFPDHARPNCKRCREHTLSANTGGYSSARSALPGKVLESASERLFDSLVHTHPPSWHDRRAFILDGTTFTLVANEELTASFPPATNQNGTSHWPVLHVVVAHELSSGLAAAPAYGPMYGPKAIGEVDLAVRVLDALPPRSILLADRNFGVFGFAHPATVAGHDVVVRLTKSRFHAIEKNAKLVSPGCWSLAWKPSRYDRQTHPELAADAVIHGWLHQVVVRKDLTLWLFTTVDGTSAELAALYAQRADVETDIRNLKIELQLDRMDAQSESMVAKELWAALMAYNLTTEVRRLAAVRLGVNPRRISFAGVLSLVRGFVAGLHADLTEAECQERFERLLRAAGQRKLPKRKPGRSYKREVIPRRRKHPARKRLTAKTT